MGLELHLEKPCLCDSKSNLLLLLNTCVRHKPSSKEKIKLHKEIRCWFLSLFNTPYLQEIEVGKKLVYTYEMLVRFTWLCYVNSKFHMHGRASLRMTLFHRYCVPFSLNKTCCLLRNAKFFQGVVKSVFHRNHDWQLISN